MADVLFRKLVSTLPDPLDANTIYAIRVGDGFDLYISDSTGTSAKKINGPELATFADMMAGTEGKVLTTGMIWNDVVNMNEDSGNILIDLSTGFDFGDSESPLILSGNKTLSFSNFGQQGQSGICWFASTDGEKTITLDVNIKTAYGIEEGPYTIHENELLGICYLSSFGVSIFNTGILRFPNYYIQP